MIHKLAVVHKTAKIAPSVKIGPWSLIGPDVEIDEYSTIGPHVVIAERTKIGKHNRIFSFSSLGDAPQHLLYEGEKSCLEIGDYNIIREYCTIHRGTSEDSITRIGNHNFFMGYTHIAHDCLVKSHTTFVNNASIAGHVQVDDHAYLGGFSGVHQYCKVGAHSFISGKAAMISKDVLAYTMVFGNPASVYGINKVGLKRLNVSQEVIDQLDKAYKIIFRKKNTTEEACFKLEILKKNCPEIQKFIDGLRNSDRGIIR